MKKLFSVLLLIVGFSVFAKENYKLPFNLEFGESVESVKAKFPDCKIWADKNPTQFFYDDFPTWEMKNEFRRNFDSHFQGWTISLLDKNKTYGLKPIYFIDFLFFENRLFQVTIELSNNEIFETDFLSRIEEKYNTDSVKIRIIADYDFEVKDKKEIKKIEIKYKNFVKEYKSKQKEDF